MSISQPAKNSVRNLFFRHARTLLFCSVFLALFGTVYEHFSFGVWSYFMVYAFAPCLIGSLWLLLISSRKIRFAHLFLGLLESGIIILTLGMLLGGVIEIYGTDNHLLIVYPILGLLLFASALIVRLIAVLDHPQ